ncbi:hypothetical protein [Aureimonas psammosilenae]|uniref:hypothetical protein n=1 Tax=Aureimonas psammosilenae TaxID=2495496 RepID=UPI0012612CA7|nr:hypothetical protein [Aureimonas psammosilenae]
MIRIDAQLTHDIVAVYRGGLYLPDMVPVVIAGRAYLANAEGVLPKLATIGVDDLVLGYAALGITFPHAPGFAGSVAIPASFAHLPSRWAARADELWSAFGPRRHAEIGFYVHDSGVRELYPALADLEEIQRHGSARRAILAHAAVMALRAYRDDHASVLECLHIAEPNADDSEIAEALEAASDNLARHAVEVTTGVRVEVAR